MVEKADRLARETDSICSRRQKWNIAWNGRPRQVIVESRQRGAGAAANCLPRAGEFVYAESGKQRSVQETLHHFFGLPIYVIAQPSGWYSCYRTPEIREFSEDRTTVLVYFKAEIWSGEGFGGTCLYAKREQKWGTYTIRPNQSQNIVTAHAWLMKRDWESW
jgi:hypothetical protein